MRKTSLDLDQESTIVSMLAVSNFPEVQATSKSSPILKLLLWCAAVLLVVAYFHENTSWQ